MTAVPSAVTRASSAVLFLATAWLALLFAIEWLIGGVGKWGASFLAAAIVCAAALSLRPPARLNFALAVGSLGASLYVVELALYLRNREVIEGMASTQVVESLRRGGVDAYPVAAPAAYIESDGIPRDGQRVFPLSGIALKTTVHCREAGSYVVYRSDRYGFNNDDRVYDSNPEIVLIGDSFAHGACVQPEENVGGALRRLGWNVVNLGYAGNGPLLELATLVEYASVLRPKTVLWLYFEGNDLQNLESEQRSPMLLRYLHAGFSQRLAGRQGELASLVRTFMYDEQETRPMLVRMLDGRVGLILRLLNLRYLITTTFWRIPVLGRIAYPDSEAGVFPLFEESMRRAQNVIGGWGGQLYFVYLPNSLRYLDGVDHQRLHLRSRVLSSVRSLQIPVIDFHEAVLALNDPTTVYPYAGAHFSSAGYALLAKTINDSLRQQSALAR